MSASAFYLCAPGFHTHLIYDALQRFQLLAGSSPGIHIFGQT
jgi:hypothetical protein